ncbi:MAG: hypothetical protein QXG10_02010 [Candidatus Hadarchaeales archaeon]
MTGVDRLFSPSSITVVGCSGLKGELELYSRLFTTLKKNVSGLERVTVVETTGKERIPKADLLITVLPEKMLLNQVGLIRPKNAEYMLIMGDLSEETAAHIKELVHRKGIVPVGPGADPGVGNGWSDLPILSCEGQNIGRKGISVICQDPSLGYSILAASEERRISLGKFLCMGSSDVEIYKEVIRYLVSDRETEVICIQISDTLINRGMLEAMKKAAAVKPLITLYTGSGDRIIMSAIKQIGAIQTEESETLLRVAAVLLNARMDGNRIAVVTNAPGAVGILKRKLVGEGLQMVAPSAEALKKISKHGVVSESGAFTVGADPNAIKHVVKEISQRPEIDAVIFALSLERSTLRIDDICRMDNKVKKPVLGWIIGRGKTVLTENLWCPIISSSPDEVAEIARAIHEFSARTKK